MDDGWASSRGQAEARLRAVVLGFASGLSLRRCGQMVRGLHREKNLLDRCIWFVAGDNETCSPPTDHCAMLLPMMFSSQRAKTRDECKKKNTGRIAEQELPANRTGFERSQQSLRIWNFRTRLNASLISHGEPVVWSSSRVPFSMLLRAGKSPHWPCAP